MCERLDPESAAGTTALINITADTYSDYFILFAKKVYPD